MEWDQWILEWTTMQHFYFILANVRSKETLACTSYRPLHQPHVRTDDDSSAANVKRPARQQNKVRIVAGVRNAQTRLHDHGSRR